MSDEIQQAQTELSQAIARAEALGAGEPGRDLVPARSTDPVEAKRQIAETQAEILKAQEVVKRASERLESAMKRELERVREVMSPLERAVKQLQQGLFSINLYLGRDEEIVLLRDGGSAPAEQPITLRQMLLFMDEEIAAALPEGGFMPHDIEEFDQWLLADPANLDQVLPETKGIVALRPRRKRPRDGWHSNAEAQENLRTYWLVRNGERVYRTVTLLELEDRVLPYSDEIERLFMRRRAGGQVEPMRPGSNEWEQAQNAAADRERTYLRVGLVLEGLLHRTPIFHPLPDAGVSFLDPRDVAAGKVRYITDAEGLLGTGQESFEDWRRRLAEELRPGMRIVLGPGLREYNYDKRQGNDRLSPTIANLPKVGALYTLETRGHGRDWMTEQSGTSFQFRYREGERYVGDGAWGGGEFREPKRRASATVYAHDEFVLPFDLATVEDMQRFLRSRTDRHHYEEMFPILKAAIAAKHRETEVEEPFRVMLAGVLARENGITVEQAQQDIPDLVDWWKLKNHVHRPLLLQAASPNPDADDEGEGEPRRASAAALGMRGRAAQREARAEEARAQSEREHARQDAAEQVERSQRAVQMIVAEHARRLRDARRPVSEPVLSELRERHPHRLVIARPRGRGYLVVVAAEPEKNVYVHEHEHSARGELIEAREWILPRLQSARSWRIIEQDERWERWDFNASAKQHLRGPERDELRHQAAERFKAAERPLALAQHRKTGRLTWWTLTADATVDSARPLTGELGAPEIEVHEHTWRRDGHGNVSLHAHRDGYNNTTRVTRRGDGDLAPWDARVWRSTFDEDRSDRPQEYDVLDRNELTISELEREFERYITASEQREELRARARALVDSIEAQWLRDQWVAERARFDEDFGDPALWPAHRQSKERHIHLSAKWTLMRAIGSIQSDPVLMDAVERLVEIGEDPEGRTAGAVVDQATERWGEQLAAGDHWHRPERDGPRKRFTLPVELRDYPLSTYQFAHEPDPEPDDGQDDAIEPLVDGLLAGVRQALDTEPDAPPIYDADSDAEEIDAALPEENHRR